MKQAAFIGAGSMGGALIRAACRAVGAEQVVFTDRDAAKASALAEELGCAAGQEKRKYWSRLLPASRPVRSGDGWGIWRMSCLLCG